MFIGLGNMGLPMATRLLAAGYPTTGHDTLPKPEWQQAGGTWRDTPTQQDETIIISMLPGDPQMLALYIEEQALFKRLRENTLILDCSTASPRAVSRLAEEAQKHRLRFLSAPVSGGVTGATNGTLTFMVGGASEDLATVKPLLKIMGGNIFHAGGITAGQSVKLCNNMLLAIHMIGTCEALALGERLGLDPRTLSEIMGASSGDNWSLRKYNPWPGLLPTAPASRDYEGGFSVRLMVKDLTLALDAADASAASPELGALALEIYRRHFDAGNSERDFSHILTTLRPPQE